MQKEEKIVVMLFVISLSSLIFIYLSFPKEVEPYTALSEEGDFVYVKGIVSEKRKVGENLILLVEGKRVFIPKFCGAEELYKQIKAGDEVLIYGTVKEYRGKPEILVRERSDVILNNSKAFYTSPSNMLWGSGWNG
ncbi:MAG: OB-fold nucleic acid binding domain-containing protein [Candidatus Syntropharchaeia archaeon]